MPALCSARARSVLTFRCVYPQTQFDKQGMTRHEEDGTCHQDCLCLGALRLRCHRAGSRGGRWRPQRPARGDRQDAGLARAVVRRQGRPTGRHSMTGRVPDDRLAVSERARIELPLHHAFWRRTTGARTHPPAIARAPDGAAAPSGADPLRGSAAAWTHWRELPGGFATVGVFVLGPLLSLALRPQHTGASSSGRGAAVVALLAPLTACATQPPVVAVSTSAPRRQKRSPTGSTVSARVDCDPADA